MCLATSGHWAARAAKKSFENAHLYRRFTEGNSMETAAGRPGAARHLKTSIFTEGLQKEIAWKRHVVTCSKRLPAGVLHTPGTS